MGQPSKFQNAVLFKRRIKGLSVEELISMSRMLRRDSQELNEEMQAVDAELVAQRIARVRSRFTDPTNGLTDPHDSDHV